MVRRTEKTEVESMKKEQAMIEKKLTACTTVADLDTLEGEIADFNSRWIEQGGDAGDAFSTATYRRFL